MLFNSTINGLNFNYTQLKYLTKYTAHICVQLEVPLYYHNVRKGWETNEYLTKYHSDLNRAQ